MLGHSLRRTAALVAALALTGSASLPPAHVHRGAPDVDHDETEVVHRHIGWHRAVPSPDIDHPDLDHPDVEDALYIDDLFTIARSEQFADEGHELAVAIAGLGTAPAARAHSPLNAQTLRTHDPPWRSSSPLRGPPVLLA